MRNITSKFSLKDFLAYLFPGLTWLVAITAILSINDSIRENIIDILGFKALSVITALLCIPLAYLLGVLSSSVAGVFENIIIKIFCYEFVGNRNVQKSNESQVDLMEDKMKLRESILQCCKDFPNIKNLVDNVDDDHLYYMARTIICETIPSVLEDIIRQDTLRQLRRNSIVPLLFWCVFIVLWAQSNGAKCILDQESLSRLWIVTLMVGIVIIFSLTKGMVDNIKRRERNVFLALLCAPTILALRNNNNIAELTQNNKERGSTEPSCDESDS